MPIRSPYDQAAEMIEDILRPDVLRPSWTQSALAEAIGVSQGTISRWQSRASRPLSQNLERLQQVHHAAVCHHWDCQRLVPVCAIATSYPDGLREQAMIALTEALGRTPLSRPRERDEESGMTVDLHVRPAQLPKTVSAYTFVDDVESPFVFVVLVRSDLALSQQRTLAWREVYAHVANFNREDGDEKPLRVAASLLRHVRI